MSTIYESLRQTGRSVRESASNNKTPIKKIALGLLALGIVTSDNREVILKNTLGSGVETIVNGGRDAVEIAGDVIETVWDSARRAIDGDESAAPVVAPLNGTEGAPVVEVPPAAPTEAAPVPTVTNNLGLVTCASIEVLLVGEGASSYAAVVLPASPAIPETATDARRQIVEASLALTPELDPTTLRVGDAIRAMTDCELN